MNDFTHMPHVVERSIESFEDLQQLADAGEPVVVRGATAGWPALAAGRRSPASLNAYLLGLDQGSPAPVVEAPAAAGGRLSYANNPRDFSFSKRQISLVEALDRIDRASAAPDGPALAIQMLRLDTAMPAFGRDNPMPLLPGVSPLLWLGGAVKTQIHNDRDHNFACVIAGRRRFLLFPPDQVSNLYLGPVDNPPQLSLVDPEAPDLDRFPRFRDALAAGRIADLEPGDALMMPRHWWHFVSSLDAYNAMINYWWSDNAPGLEDPQQAFLHTLLAVKGLTPADRRYWQAMYAAYVFDERDTATEHLVPALRGHLGPSDAVVRAGLKRRLSNTFFNQ